MMSCSRSQVLVASRAPEPIGPSRCSSAARSTSWAVSRTYAEPGTLVLGNTRRRNRGQGCLVMLIEINGAF